MQSAERGGTAERRTVPAGGEDPGHTLGGAADEEERDGDEQGADDGQGAPLGCPRTGQVQPAHYRPSDDDGRHADGHVDHPCRPTGNRTH